MRVSSFLPISDRNATAMMVERAVTTGRADMLDSFLDDENVCTALEALAADPALVAWCCLKAKEEA
jgi:hypothetical protein